MQVNSGKDMSLNFMGRKLRNHTVSPATKHGAWENTDLSRYQEDSAASSRLVLSHPIVSEELPGSVSDLREDVQHSRPCKVHNTLLEHDKAGARKSGTKVAS